MFVERKPALSRSHALIPLITTTAVSLIAAGCGGSSPTNFATAQAGLFAYSHCMRTHGVPDFPDPVPGEGIPKDKIVLLNNAQSQAASSDCQHLMPPTGLGPETTVQPTRIRLAAALVFAHCVRNHGFPNFPDPTTSGQLSPEMVTAAGINLHQPALLAAGLACAPLTHGLISRAAVERAVNGGPG
jgi:hypothetical protein